MLKPLDMLSHFLIIDRGHVYCYFSKINYYSLITNYRKEV